MHQLQFTLKQHTPIIHFQHDQDGATLRATEVKPKLDRFIIEAMKSKNKPIPDNWYNNKEKGSLDYKIRLNIYNSLNKWNLLIKKGDRNSSIPTFFGNMGDSYENNEKSLHFIESEFKNSLLCSKLDLLNVIEEILVDFFLVNNFGTRQSKGFGSFSIGSINDKQKAINLDVFYNKCFSINLDKEDFESFKSAFGDIELFYKSIRGGINQKRKLNNPQQISNAINNNKYHKGPDGNDYEDVCYIKSFLFLYENSISIDWEKRQIKNIFFKESRIQRRDGTEMYFPYRLDEQQEQRERINPSPLHATTSNYKLVRDLLGFSSEENWKSYKSKIEKVQAIKQKEKWVEIKKEDRTFVRFKSPITIKPILDSINSKLLIYIILNQKDLDNAISQNKDFMIKNERNNFKIEYPNHFDLYNYFNFICDKKNIKIEKIVEQKFHNSNEYNKLLEIFNQLQK